MFLVEDNGEGPEVRLRKAMSITPEQVREARRLLKWPLVRLAARAGVSDKALYRFEKGAVYRRADFPRPNLDTVRAALEAAGVEFITEGGDGVRLRKPAHATIPVEDLNPSNDE